MFCKNLLFFVAFPKYAFFLIFIFMFKDTKRYLEVHMAITIGDDDLCYSES